MKTKTDRTGLSRKPGAQAPRRTSIAAISAVGAVVVFVSVVIATGLGTVTIPPLEVLRAILVGLRLLPSTAVDPTDLTIVLSLRLPRVAMALVAGAGLALSGTVLQGVFRNPLADPGILGVATGAGLGALIGIVTDLGRPLGLFAVPVFAFVGALAAVGIILGVSFTAGGQGRGDTVTLIMSGMATSAIFGALISLTVMLSNQYQVTSYVFWTMGGLANRRWEHVLTALPVVSVSGAYILVRARDLDILLLGDEQARSLGVHPTSTRVTLLIAATLCTASVVAMIGPIGFVGLIVPHILRLLIGPAHRALAVASLFAGGVFLLLCDLVVRIGARTSGGEVSVGVVTALIGAPYFLFLLVRSGKGKGAFL